MTIVPLDIHQIAAADRDWAVEYWTQHYGSAYVVSRGVRYDARELPGFVAWAVVNTSDVARRVGVATYHIAGRRCELLTLDSLEQGVGVGSALIAAVAGAARGAGCTALWLITSNDNTHALRFYQKRGFRLKALHPDAITKARLLKPEIPLLGDDGIEIRDEIELQMPL